MPVQEEKAALPPIPSQLDTAKPASKGEQEATEVGGSRRAGGADELTVAPAEGQKRSSTKSSPYRGVTLFKPTMKWRAQISAGGKTTSLGDHDTEEEAARAFDRAAINKAGAGARTNFNIEEYKDEIADLQGMQQSELVAMLRSWARKSGTQTSHYRGVSLLKQTQKWHAQINVGGKQVHLGFFPTEEQAARAYDRAAINKGARDGGKIITNFDIADYQHELDRLRRIGQHELVEALASETKRRQTMEMLASGSFAHGEQIFGSGFDSRPDPTGVCSVAAIEAKAERAQPKPTQANPLYANFGKPRHDENGQRLPAVTWPANYTSPINTPARRPGRPRALFRRRKKQVDSSDESSSEGSDNDDEDTLEAAEAEGGRRPSRRSARNVGRVVKHYSEASSDEEAEEASRGEVPQPGPHTPQQTSPTAEWAAASPPFRRRAKGRGRNTGKADSEDEEAGPRRKEEPAAPIQPAERPTWELLAHAVAAAHGGEPPATPQPPAPSAAGTSAALVPTPDTLPRLHSAATAGSRATADAPDARLPRPPTTDQTSTVRVRRALGDKPSADVVPVEAGPLDRSLTPVAAEDGVPSVAQAAAAAAAGRGSVEQMLRTGSLGEKGSVAMRPIRDKASTLAGFGTPAGDKLSDAGAVARPATARENSSVERISLGDGDGEAPPASDVPATPGKRVPPRKGIKRKETKEPSASADGKPPEGKPMTKRQKAMLERQMGQLIGKVATEDPSPKPSDAPQMQPSPRASVAGNQEDAASQSSPQARLQAAKSKQPPTKTLISSSDDSHGPKAVVPVKQFDVASSEEPADSPIRREGPNRRKRKAPARAAI